MRNCNWMVVDRANKASDLVRHIKSLSPDLESKIVKICEVNTSNYQEIKTAWLKLPDRFKSKAKNLGVA